jgi:two-component system, NtrC family, sensor histidine kinase HydH
MTPEEIQALVDRIPIAACVVVERRIVAANQRLVAMTGYGLEALRNSEMPIAQFVVPQDQARMLARQEARLAGGQTPDEEFDFQGRAADGSVLPARLRIAAFPAAGPGAQLGLVTDERVRQRAAGLIHGFIDVAVAAQKERTQAAFFRVVRERLVALGLTSTLLEIEGDRFRFAPFAPAITKVGAEMRQRLPDWAPLSQLGIDLTGAGGTLVDDLPRFLERLGRLPEAAYEGRVPARAVVAPIPVGGVPKFVISCSGEDLDNAVAGAFGILGRQLGAALETTLRLEELDRRNAELSLLLDLGQEVVGALDVNHVLDAAARTATLTLRCSCAYVFLPDETEAALRICARVDPDPPPGTEPGTTLPMGIASLSSLAFRSRKPHSSDDTATDPRIDPEITRRFRCRASLAVPLLSQGRSLGVLALFERSGRTFDAQDVRLASHAAQLTAAALENARLYAEQRARAEEMALLNDAARRLAGSLELGPLLELGGETLRRVLDGASWFILLPDPAAGGLRIEATQEDHADMRGMLLRFEETSMAATAFRERRVVQLLDPLSAPSTASRTLALRFDNRVTLAAPLIARDQVLGVTVVLGRHLRLFSPLEMERALAVAGQLALALLSARLYQDLRESYAQLARTQQELVDRERLAALGELSASIAHEVRNPLGVIFNSVGSLRRLLTPKGDVALLLDIVGEEADRLNRMVGDLLDYSRPLRPSLSGVPLAALLREALDAARRQVGPAADQLKISLDVAGGADTVRADARLLRQALVNLLLNACQAMPRGGQLTLRAARRDQGGAPFAELSIHDTGSGIPSEARDKVFQPFFTTKAMGTGLGLAVVRRIIEGHGGSIGLGNPPTGTEFVLRLPLDA